MTMTKKFRLNNVAEWDEIFQRWNCKYGTFLDAVLGFLLAAGFKYRPAWNELVDKFRSRLATWKKRYITKTGRLILIKSTLASLSIFLLSLLVVPVSLWKLWNV